MTVASRYNKSKTLQVEKGEAGFKMPGRERYHSDVKVTADFVQRGVKSVAY